MPTNDQRRWTAIRTPATCDSPRTLLSSGTRNTWRTRVERPARRGLTLVELLISMAILSLMAVVLAGMSNAVHSAWSYTKGVEESDLQARAAIERIEYMVSQIGCYKLAGQPTRLGLAVVNRPFGNEEVPDVLVLWTGGRLGGMAAQGVQARLPTVGELVIYSWKDNAPHQLIEVAFPGQTAGFDFGASDLRSQVATLLASASAESIPLCNRLRVCSPRSTSWAGGASTPLGPGGSFGPSSAPAASGSSSSSIGSARFTLTLTPSDTELATAAPQTTAWTKLSWPQGAYSSRSGMRQATLQIELQIEPDGIARASDSVIAIPFFGSASARYVYEP